MIDLHIHTNNSDGSDSVIEVLQKAEKLGLSTISITDHDTCKAYEELEKIDIKKYYSGKIIRGVELRCFYNRRIIELLGYNIDTKEMQKWLDDFYKTRTRDAVQTRYLKQLYETCMELKLHMKPIEEIEWDPNSDWAARIIYREMKSDIRNKELLPEDLWNEYDCFRHHYCYNLENIFYIDKSPDLPTPKELIAQIKKVGGLVFVPHILLYKWAENKDDLIYDLIGNYGIEGIECYYNSFTDEQTNYLKNICKNKKILISGGSDYHGTKRPEVELGIGQGTLNIPDEIIEEWGEFI